jgi:hypothetical protein
LRAGGGFPSEKPLPTSCRLRAGDRQRWTAWRPRAERDQGQAPNPSCDTPCGQEEAAGEAPAGAHARPTREVVDVRLRDEVVRAEREAAAATAQLVCELKPARGRASRPE